LPHTEAKIEELQAVVVTANDAAENATTATAAARDATQTTAQEKMALEAKVAELEQDLVTVGSDLRTVNDSSSR
jgi:hypothetical protein